MKPIQRYILTIYILAAVITLLSGCSTTSSLPEGEQLYIGLEKIQYDNYTSSPHFLDTQMEIEAALAAAPNGAFFGSSYYRSPIPYRLWIWNAFNRSQSFPGKWLCNAFGQEPKLMSEVNPELRTSVAKSILDNNGYFRSRIDYTIHESSIGTTRNDTVARPLKAKIAYTVDMGPAYTYDSIAYEGFTYDQQQLISRTKPLLHKGDPFSVYKLDSERQRISTLFRNHGYYYYDPTYTTYLADTIKNPTHVQLKIHRADTLSELAEKKWIIGRTTFRIRRTTQEQITDSIERRRLKVLYGGAKPPIRIPVVLQDIRQRPGQLFSQESLDESLTNLSQKGIFSSANITFSPRRKPDGTLMILPDTVSQLTRDGESRVGAGVLDMLVDCTLDKPYDFSLQANYVHKSTGRGGPGTTLGLAKRNAFRGGEILSFNIGGSVEFQTMNTNSDNAVTYNIMGDVTLEMPRLLLPSFLRPRRRLYYVAPTTLLRTSFETISRSSNYRRNIISAELGYTFQPNERVRHSFSPLVLDYAYNAEMSDEYRRKLIEEASIMQLIATEDNFIPKMRYTFSYNSPKTYANPVYVNAMLMESGNIVALGMMAAGKSWSEKDKKLLNVKFSQFTKFELEWCKTWRVGTFSTLLAHAFGGIGITYGNSSELPFSEQYYVGGANDLRGFSTRGVGPGSVVLDADREVQYLMRNGNMKLLFNLEYRPRLFGSLYGALFLDAGNSFQVNTAYADEMPESRFRLNRLPRDLAVSAGAGVRYDLDFFVLRLDWGFVLHDPCAAGTGYFNTPKFSRAQCLNFAIGYPF